MTTTTPRKAEAPETTPGPRRRRWLIGLLALLVAVAGLAIWAVVAATGADDSGEAELPPGVEPIDAAVEAEIDVLVDAWLRAWNEGDGQAAMDLFTTDGRYVGGYTTVDGWSRERLRDYVDRYYGSSSSRSQNVILERENMYFVAQKYQFSEGSPWEYLSLYTIVDDGGELKFRFVEDWSPLGWRQLAEGQPYTRYSQELGIPTPGSR